MPRVEEHPHWDCLYVTIGFVQSTICIDQIKKPLFKKDWVWIPSFSTLLFGLCRFSVHTADSYSCFPLSFYGLAVIFCCSSHLTANMCRCSFAVIAHYYFLAWACMTFTPKKCYQFGNCLPRFSVSAGIFIDYFFFSSVVQKYSTYKAK